MRLRSLQAPVALMLLVPSLASSSPPPYDPDKVIMLEPVVVVADRIRFGSSLIVNGRDDLNEAMESLGLLTIHRGLPLAADLYADGFKRADLSVVVDGERYHCACPNRMDPPTSLALPADIESISWEPDGSAVSAGLAGQLALRRAEPSEEWRARGGVTGGFGSGEDLTASAALDGHRQRLSARWTQGHTYRDGAGALFGDRYGYREADPGYSQGDIAWNGASGPVRWTLQGSLTDDAPFPYLQMDERENELWSASVGVRETAKFYLNHTRHVMDNALRTSASTMPMRTDATQLTVGATGEAASVRFEGFYREWNARNTIGGGPMKVSNHMIPDYRQQSTNIARGANVGGLRTDARVGLVRMRVQDAAALSRYQELEPDAKQSRWFVPAAFGVNVQRAPTPRLTTGFGLEFAIAPPSAEELFIVVRRPVPPTGTPKPDWIGNPRLAAPKRLSARAIARMSGIRLEAQASRVWDYVLPVSTSRTTGDVTKHYKTYTPVNAALTGVSLRGGGRQVEWQAAWTVGWNLTSDGPLAEIAPLNAAVIARSPERAGVSLFGRVEAAARQPRVDGGLSEVPTDAWARLDLGLDWRAARGAVVSLSVVNVTDALYSQHLSYLRDPFAAGTVVTEPGRAVRLAFSADVSP